MAETAVNPDTGETVQYNEQSGQWEPIVTPLGQVRSVASGVAQALPSMAERAGYETLGGTGGAIVGSGLGPFGALAGGVLGTMAGSEAARLKQQTRGQPTGGTMESAQAGLAGPVFGRLGELGGAAMRYGLHPARGGFPQAIPRLNLFQTLGVPPNLAAVTGSRPHSIIWEGASKMPGGARIGQEWAEEATDALQRGALGLVPERAGNRYMAGQTILEGAKAAETKFFAKANTFRNAYNRALGEAKPTVDVSGYLDALGGPMRKFGPEQAQAYSSGKFGERMRALVARHGIKDETGQVVGLRPVPWDEADSIRMSVGEDVGKARKVGVFQDMAFEDLSRQYGAITQDMEDALLRTGNLEAEKAWGLHKKFYRRGAAKIKQSVDKILKSNKPEQFFSAMERGEYGQARKAWGVMPQDMREAVRGEAIYRMGKATPGGQDATGEVFSVDRFVTNYNRMREENVLPMMFGRNKQAMRDLEDLVSVASNLKELKVMENMSRTAPTSNVMNMIDKYGGMGGMALLFLDMESLGGGLLAGTYGGRAVARMMTKPSFIRWVVEGRRFNPAELGFGNHLARLGGLTGMDSAEQAILEQMEDHLSQLAIRPAVSISPQSPAQSAE